MSEGMNDPSLVTEALTAGRAQPGDHVLITGGAGFIGTNVADRMLDAGVPVLLFDNVSRPGVERNLEWLRERHGDRVRVELGDVRDSTAVRRAVRSASHVVHLAAQVAVTTSLDDPTRDFAVNAGGTLNVLDAVRTAPHAPPLLFTSTNKVYGDLADIELEGDRHRYQPVDTALRGRGIDERRPLAFQSPYGCSKGAADQYVLDFARSFGLRTVVFRMSCIYGLYQHGTEDQGWVAHFAIRALRGEPITVYGDGRQVRDVLFAGDLVDAMLLALDRIDDVTGHAFNIGGGPTRSTSLLELVDMIGDVIGSRPEIRFGPWRSGDQRYYVSDVSRFSALTGWRPRHPMRDGLQALCGWLEREHPDCTPFRDSVSGAGAPHTGELPLPAAAASDR
jgi:CDP-paratose 2-epimerase